MSEEKEEFHPKRISRKEMEKITKKIEGQLSSFIKEGHYKDVLIKMGNLGHYSLNNQIYILMQKPDATTVHGLRAWNNLHRSIKLGEKAIRIFAPIITKEDELDEEGKPIGKRKEVRHGYKLGYVFDVSQTNGKDLDVFKFDEKKAVENKESILRALWKVANENGFHVGYASKEELGEGCYGLCNHRDHEIHILKGMSDLQEISTTVHELGHALAHSAPRKDFEGLTQVEKREIKEVEAESIACTVCSYLGLDTTNFNFSYITGWADGDIDKFRKNLSVIQKHSMSIINGIEKEMARERIAKKESEIKAPLPSIIKKPEMEADL